MKKIILVVGSILIYSLLTAFSQSVAGPKETTPVKIGYIASITGPVALKVEDMTRGVQLAVKEINNKGGILGGRKVELIMYDAKSVPEEAVTATRKAIYADKVNGIVGFDEASLSLAAKPIIMKAKIPFMNTMSMHKDLIKKPGEVGFMSSAIKPAQHVGAQVKFDQELLGIKSAVIIGPDLAFFWGCADIIRSHWDQPGSPVKILDVVSFPLGSPDITAPILKAAGLKPDLIWSFAWGITDNIQIYKQLAQVGYKGHIQQCHGMLILPILEAAGKAAEGAWGLTSWGPELDHPESQAFKKALMKEFGPKAGMSDVTEFGYAGTIALLLAMNKAGTATDVAAIDKACQKLNWVPPRGYPWELESDGWSVWRETTVVRAKDGKPVPVAKIPR